MEEAVFLSAQLPFQSNLLIEFLRSHLFTLALYCQSCDTKLRKAEPEKDAATCAKGLLLQVAQFYWLWLKVVTTHNSAGRARKHIHTHAQKLYRKMHTNTLQVEAKGCVCPHVYMGNSLLRRSTSYYATMWRCRCESHDLAELLIMKFIIFL